MDKSEPSITRQELAEMARTRASFGAFVNVHFNQLPDEKFVQRIRSTEFAAALDALANDEAIAEVAAGAALMRSYIRNNDSVSEPQMAENLGVDRTRLYRGVAPGYGPTPPWEAVWTSEDGDTAKVLKQLADTYLAAGMMVSPEARERLDYIGVELDYFSLLARSEADAWDAGDDEKARRLLQLESDFLSTHLVRWVPAFVEKALPQAGTDFYRGHMMMLRGFLFAEQERLPVLAAELPSSGGGSVQQGFCLNC